MSIPQEHSEFNSAKAEAIAEQFLTALNHGSLRLLFAVIARPGSSGPAYSLAVTMKRVALTMKRVLPPIWPVNARGASH